MLKRKVFKISSGAKFGKVVAFLRKQLGMDSGTGGGGGGGSGGSGSGMVESGETVVATAAAGRVAPRGGEGLWCYVNQSFAPALDAEVGGLWKASCSDIFFFPSFLFTHIYIYITRL